jgi:alpha-tubulin suppressor-like RCC1 family protein
MSLIDLENTNRVVDNPRAPRTARTRRQLASWFFLAATVAPSAGCAVSAEATEPSEDPLSGSLIGIAQSKTPLFDSIVEIIAGGNRTCVRRSRSGYFCWGANPDNFLGLASGAGTTCAAWNFAYYPTLPASPPFPCALQPTPVTVISASQLTLGYDHTCARDAFGQAFCWGADAVGQLGTNNGAYAAQRLPTPVAPALGAIGGQTLTFTDISAGTGSTCGIEAGTGAIYCWGLLLNLANVPVPLLIDSSGQYTFDPMYPIGPVLGASKITTGMWHACATFPSSTGTPGFCVGDNSVGQTGPGTLSNTVSRVSTKRNFTCVDQSNGTVECFGDNSWGQLGNNSYNPTGTPQSVGSGMALHGVTVGDQHACALDPSGAAYCWGLNGDGQAGQRYGYSVPVPTAVPGNLTFRALAAGSTHTCGLTTSDHLFCWGDNSSAQLGNGRFWGSWDYNPEAVPDP